MCRHAQNVKKVSPRLEERLGGKMLSGQSSSSLAPGGYNSRGKMQSELRRPNFLSILVLRAEACAGGVMMLVLACW